MSPATYPDPPSIIIIEFVSIAPSEAIVSNCIVAPSPLPPVSFALYIVVVIPDTPYPAPSPSTDKLVIEFRLCSTSVVAVTIPVVES